MMLEGDLFTLCSVADGKMGVRLEDAQLTHCVQNSRFQEASMFQNPAGVVGHRARAGAVLLRAGAGHRAAASRIHKALSGNVSRTGRQVKELYGNI